MVFIDAITYMQLRLFTPMECTMWVDMVRKLGVCEG